MAMAKSFTSMFLVLTLCATVQAGLPLHFNEEKCAHGMSGMDCCKAARRHSNETDVGSERMCCVADYPQSGTSGPTRVQLPKRSLALDALHPAVVQPSMPTPIPFLIGRRAHSPPRSANPAYIRNLALLI